MHSVPGDRSRSPLHSCPQHYFQVTSMQQIAAGCVDFAGAQAAALRSHGVYETPDDGGFLGQLEQRVQSLACTVEQAVNRAVSSVGELTRFFQQPHYQRITVSRSSSYPYQNAAQYPTHYPPAL